MSGNVNRAAVWAEADVLVGDLNASTPVGIDGKPDGSEFSADWHFVGLLNGEDGFSTERDLESDDFYAWGGLLVATTRRNFKLTRTFTALEDNAVVFGLVYPGSDLTFSGSDEEYYTGQLMVPNLQHKFKIAFETRTGNTVKRAVSKNYAQVEEVGEATESESDLQSYPITVTIYPDDQGVLFDVYKGPADDES